MTEAESVAQGQLDILVRVVEMLGDFLRRIDRWLQPSPQELSGEDEGSACDVTTEIRRAIQCALADHIEPLIAQLRAASTYKPAVVEPKSGKPVRRPGKDRRKKKADRRRRE